MKENIILEKSFQFAVMVVKLYQQLTSEKKEFILSKQFVRSGTSIGANIEEATGGCSKKDFIAKFHIAFKEARETSYWLKLLIATGYVNEANSELIRNKLDEILKIITSILKSSKGELRINN